MELKDTIALVTNTVHHAQKIIWGQQDFESVGQLAEKQL